MHMYSLRSANEEAVVVWTSIPPGIGLQVPIANSVPLVFFSIQVQKSYQA